MALSSIARGRGSEPPWWKPKTLFGQELNVVWNQILAICLNILASFRTLLPDALKAAPKPVPPKGSHRCISLAGPGITVAAIMVHSLRLTHPRPGGLDSLELVTLGDLSTIGYNYRHAIHSFKWLICAGVR